MKKLFVLLGLLACSLQVVYSRPDIPEKIQFADLQVSLNQGAENYISDFIGKLKKSPTYFQQLVERARIYMPLVDQAFKEAKVPSDLKYIVLQESSLNGSAVSRSGAVGYWQIKEPAAREVGLVIDKFVDERKHIYRSSFGAATYFKQINQDFDHWLFAVIGYNRGPVGALSYINKGEFGMKKVKVTQHTHEYALKALAFKIAFEGEIPLKAAPVQLSLVSNQGETKVDQLAKAHAIDNAKLREFNPWIKGNQLPKDRDFLIVVPSSRPPIAISQPTSPTVSPPVPPKPTPKPVAPDRQPGKFTYLTPETDPEYGEEYAIVAPGEQLVEISVHHHVKLKKIHTYNGTNNKSPVPAGTQIYLKNPSKVGFHIAQQGDTWSSIGAFYDIHPDKLRKNNRIRGLGAKIWPGQKIYLKKKKPKGEKILILEPAWMLSQPQPSQKAPEKKVVSVETTRENTPTPSGKIYQYHAVRAGETLWSISQRYQTSVDALKRLNNLSDNQISVGQKLKVPQE